MIIALDLFIFLLTVYGASYIVTASVLFDQPRGWLTYFFDSKYESSSNFIFKFTYDKLAYLINCTICASVWLAALLFLLLQNSSLISLSPNIYDLIIYTMISPVFTMYMNEVLMEEENSDD